MAPKFRLLDTDSPKEVMRPGLADRLPRYLDTTGKFTAGRLAPACAVICSAKS